MLPWDDYEKEIDLYFSSKGPNTPSLKKYRNLFSRKPETKECAHQIRSNGKSFEADRQQNVFLQVKRHFNKSNSYYSAKVAYCLNNEKTQNGVENNIGNTTREDFLGNVQDRAFHFVISPERADLDNEKLAKDFMNRLKVQDGYNLRWIGGIHQDTGHPHIHIYIDGYDRNGEKIIFPRECISYKYRNDLKRFATQQVGYRTEVDIQKSLDKCITQNRFTDLDRIIEKSVHIDGSLNILEMETFLSPAMYRRVTERINHLASLGLCKRNQAENRLSMNWKDTLVSLGRYNTFLDGRNNLVYNSPLGYQQYKGGAAIGGHVSRIYKANAGSYHDAFVVEAPDGKSFFVPLHINKYNVKEGDYIRVFAKPGAKGLLDPDINIKSELQIKAMYPNSVSTNIFSSRNDAGARHER